MQAAATTEQQQHWAEPGGDDARWKLEWLGSDLHHLLLIHLQPDGLHCVRRGPRLHHPPSARSVVILDKVEEGREEGEPADPTRDEAAKQGS